MAERLVIDLITDDTANDEFVLYLVEDQPWGANDLEDRLRSIQDRIYNVIDAAVDGHLAAKFPDSKGRDIRIQVDAHNDPPPDLETFISRFDEFVRNNPAYQTDIQNCPFIGRIRVVTRSQMGRD